MEIIDILLTLAAVGLAVPMTVLCVECVAALVPGRASAASARFAGRVDILIPAHNEELVLKATLAQVRKELGPDDRVWVIADNSTDRTAEIARSSGARVFERHDPQRRGKGYALDFARWQLADDHGDVAVVLDADCQMFPGSLGRIASLAHATGRPVQAGYSMFPATGDCRRDGVSQLAVLVKNVVRPLGLARLGLPCVLTGSGMAFPWSIFAGVPLATGNIVEDMQLSVDLMLSREAPIFCAEAGLTALLPADRRASVSQRTRWEHGHLQVIVSQVPRLLRRAIVERRLALVASALDIAVPPLSLLLLAWLATTAVAWGHGLLAGSWLPATILTSCGALLLSSVLAVTFVFSPGGWRTISAVPAYVVTKIPIYAGFLWRRQTAWVRTARHVSSTAAENQPAAV